MRKIVVPMVFLADPSLWTVPSSFNCVDWFLLPTVTDSMMEQVAKAARGYFTGDPSFVYEAQTHTYTEADNAAEDAVVSIIPTQAEMSIKDSVMYRSTDIQRQYKLFI